MESGERAKLPMHLGASVVRDETTVAEIKWVLKIIESDCSGKFVDDKTGVYGKMFRETLVKNFSFGPAKFVYF